MSTSTLALRAFGAVSVVHLAARLTRHRRIAHLTQPILIPALVAQQRTSTSGSRPRTWVDAGLAASWAGDSLPLLQRGTKALRTKMVCFAGTHLAYVAGFGPMAIRQATQRPASLVGPVLGYGALNLLVQPLFDQKARERGLHAALVGYAALLTATGVVTAAVGGRAGWGGALFVTSDALIAVREFAPERQLQLGRLDLHGFLVMAMYLSAQALILRAADDGSATP